MGKSTISMAIFHCYVSSPEGTQAMGKFLKLTGAAHQSWVGWSQRTPPLPNQGFNQGLPSAHLTIYEWICKVMDQNTSYKY